LLNIQKRRHLQRKRVETRKKQGKPAELTPSEAVNKTAKSVKSKVVDMKDKGLSSGEIDKLANGIIATIKSTLAGIKTTTGKHAFLSQIRKEITTIDGGLSKVAMEGGLFADGGMMAKGGETGQMATAKYYWNKFDILGGTLNKDKEKRVDFLVSAGYSKSVANDLSSESWDSLEKGVHKDLLSVLMADGGMTSVGGTQFSQEDLSGFFRKGGLQPR
jgi:hypothetical protein